MRRTACVLFWIRRAPWVRGAAALLVILGALTQASAASPFPDKNLELAVRALIFEKRDPNTELTDEDLKKVFILEAKGKGIKDLAGLEKCTNLQLVNFSKNEITDVAALKGLNNLQSIDLSHNQIADLSPLAALPGVQYLEISGNQVADLSPLAEYARLSALYAARNRVKDLTPVAKLKKLSSLDLAGNEIADLGPVGEISGLSLLKVSDNPVEDLAPAMKHPDLKLLIAERTKVADLSAIVQAAEADAAGPQRFAPFLRLYLAGAPLSESARTQQIPALKKAGVRIDLGESK